MAPHTRQVCSVDITTFCVILASKRPVGASRFTLRTRKQLRIDRFRARRLGHTTSERQLHNPSGSRTAVLRRTCALNNAHLKSRTLCPHGTTIGATALANATTCWPLAGCRPKARGYGVPERREGCMAGTTFGSPHARLRCAGNRCCCWRCVTPRMAHLTTRTPALEHGVSWPPPHYHYAPNANISPRPCLPK